MNAAGMSLEDKAGQVFMLGFQGKDPKEARYAVDGLRAGGIIYFGRNTGTPGETAELSWALQEMAASLSGVPLLIAADQEGGAVTRLSSCLPAMPGAMALGAAGDPALTREVALATGTQLRAAGVNVNLAPVLDVNDNPFNPVIGVRSFGGDADAVCLHGAAAVKGYLASGVLPVGKHFPGHGNTSVDSHLDLPVLSHAMKRLEQVELKPFRAAVLAGLPAMMPAHIVFKAVDPVRPATMSEPVLQGLLRRGIGFGGLILTDCLEMDAVARDPGTPRAAVLALKAGADLLLVSHTRETQVAAVKAVVEAVRSGEVPESRLDEAAGRVLALKGSMSLPNPLPAANADTPAFRELSRRAHLRSITPVRCLAGSFPLRGPAEVAVIGPEQVASLLAGCLNEVAGVRARPAEHPGAGATVVLTENAWKDPEQAARAKRVLDARPDAVVVAARDPFDLRALPRARTYVCAYSPRVEAMRAVSRVLAGLDRATGNLPVEME